MAGKFIRGALIQFMDTFLVPLPNVIVFQYNPETITHALTQAARAPAGSGTPSAAADTAPLAVSGPPGQTFSFTLVMDANDQIASGNPIAAATGIYSRLAALETLMYPTGGGGGGLTGSVSISAAGLGASASGAVSRDVPPLELPTVLFIWGPARILPVRVTSLSISEKLYDPLLNPIHAEANITLTVLTPRELQAATDELAEIARGAYAYTDAARQVLAIANLANAAESIIGMIPV